MRAILLVAHGSRRSESNDEVVKLANKLSDQIDERFSRVEAAFLEIAQPDITTAVQGLVVDGFDFITVVPYFLAPGSHVVNDIPAILQKIQSDQPDLGIAITTHIGASELMPSLVLKCTEL